MREHKNLIIALALLAGVMALQMAISLLVEP